MSKKNPVAFIDFLKMRYLYFAISGIVIIPGLISLALFGLKPSIDFTGGTLVEIVNSPDKQFTEEAITTSLPEGVVLASIQNTANNSVIVRTSPMDKDGNELFKAALASASGLLEASQAALINPASLIQENRFETVGPTLGKELLQKTLVAIVLAAIMITLFVASRFSEIKYGVCAILAMFHDTLVLLGTFSLLGHFFGIEVDTLYVTAVLTTLSFSVHDTIVVYDRIRESRKLYPGFKYSDLVNKAISETLTRSINNSMTIIFMLLALVLLGGESTRWFSLALLIGTITGTYSSTFTAAPLLVTWDRVVASRNKRKN
jgi:preprotein translocase subunit SecF